MSQIEPADITAAAASVSDGLIRRFAADGIDAIFGLTGGGIMYLVDAIARSPSVRLVPVHHEEYAGVAADGYARAGKPYGVALATTGPGAAQLFAAVAAAWQDSSPVIFVVGQVKSADSSFIQGLALRQNGTFEFDTTKSFAPITKYVTVVRDAQEAEAKWSEAIRSATSGRPGPVLLEFPLDVQGALWEPGQPEVVNRSQGVVVQDLTQTLRRSLMDAKRPLVLLGIGTVRAAVHAALTGALDAAGIPYIVTQFARQAGDSEHSLYLGSPGIKANRSANLALMSADLLIAIGSSLHQQVVGWDAEKFRTAPARKIWFELDQTVLATRGCLVDEAHNLSSQDATASLLAAIATLDTSARWSDWQRQCRRLRAKYLLHYPAHEPVPGRMDLYRAVSTLNARAHLFSSAVTDAGIAWYALAQHYFPPAGSSFISSGSFGAMGMALPHAIGAAAATGMPVLAFTGDGSLMMCLSELATLKAAGFPVLLVINNNDGYVSIRSTQDRFFEGRRLGTDGSNGVAIPHMGDVAALFEIPFWSATSEQTLNAALDAALKDGLSGPAIIDVATYTDQAVEPFLASRRLADGTFETPSLADMEPAIGGDDVL